MLLYVPCIALPGCRHMRAGSTASTFAPSAFQYQQPRQSGTPPDFLRGMLPTAAELPPVSGNLVKLGKQEGWASFLAYEVCQQLK